MSTCPHAEDGCLVLHDAQGNHIQSQADRVQRHPEDDFLYRVFEEVDGVLEPRMVGAYARNPRTGEFSKSQYNDKKRIYTDLSTARTYKKRLAKEGRTTRIFRYVCESEVT